MTDENDPNIEYAKLAERAERYDDMAKVPASSEHPFN